MSFKAFSRALSETYPVPESGAQLAGQHLELLKILSDDLRRNEQDKTAYALDFSDLFLYMHQGTTPRPTLQTIDYMLENQSGSVKVS
jgi:hypothetical protein